MGDLDLEVWYALGRSYEVVAAKVETTIGKVVGTGMERKGARVAIQDRTFVDSVEG